MNQAEYQPLSLPIYWMGTKVRMRDKILPIIDRFKRKLYVEPFGGACGMLFGKKPEKCEVYNDANCLLTNLFTVLRNPDNISTLDSLLSVSPMGREMFNTLRELPAAWIESDNELVGILKHSLNLTDYSDEIAVAYAFFYCMNTCYSGRVNKRTSFAGGQKGDCADNTIRRYYKARTSLQQFADRFATVYIENLHYEACVRKYDDKETFFYLDPPYSVEVSSGYGTGWSESEEEMLVELLSEIEGSFVLSCYDNERYEGLLECGATRETFNAFSTIAQNGGGATAKRVETIYWRGHNLKQTSQTNLWDWLTMETQ